MFTVAGADGRWFSSDNRSDLRLTKSPRNNWFNFSRLTLTCNTDATNFTGIPADGWPDCRDMSAETCAVPAPDAGADMDAQVNLIITFDERKGHFKTL